MDSIKILLDFLADILSSWPLVVLVIILLFHKEIGANVKLLFELLSRMKSVTIGDHSATFGEQLAQIDQQQEEAVGAALLTRSGLPKESSYFSTETAFEQLAALRPDYTILDSWQAVERKLVELWHQELQHPENKSPSAILSELQKIGALSPDQLLFIKENLQLRNKVVHREFAAISYSDAVLYRQNCLEIMQILDGIRE